MAFIRAFGGGGIPSALKSAMNAVLNKKFGTSTTYAPEDWPEDVNLLGPLPEKTASGSIAHVEDGADDVPVKSAKFYFLPQQASGTPTPSSPLAIDGWTGLTAYRQKKNLLDVSTAQGIGTIWFYYDNGIKLKKGTAYTLSCGNYGSGSVAFYGLDHTTQVAYAYISASSAKVTYTPTEDIIVCPRIFQSGLTVLGLVDVMLEVGSTATSYEAYSTPTSYPVSWSEHGTIYGGYVDAVRGKVVKTHGSVDLGTLDWTITQTLQEERAFYTDDLSSVIDPPSSNNIAIDGYCENLPVNSQNNVMNTSASGICSSTSGRVFIFNYSYNSMTKEQFTSAVNGKLFVYPLATPEEYDITAFTPSTYLGSNNFYSDANGETEITYRADISLALAANSSRGLMMASRSIPEDEILNENTEEVENDENIRQDPADR